MENVAMTELTFNSKKAIDGWLQKFPKDKRQSAIIPALTIVQEENTGWLTKELISAVADYLKVPRISVYEVATFYSMFALQPIGKYTIYVCTNVSCMLCAAEELATYLKNKLAINFGEITKDGKFSLQEVECLAACGAGPVIKINHQYYENITPERIDQILAELE